MDKLRRISKAPILSIIEETAKECKRLNVKETGLLASTKTAREGLHSKELAKNHIKIILPNNKDQDFISKCIVRIINNKVTKKDKLRMVSIIEHMGQRGADSIILGCTDLPLLLTEEDSRLPLIDTCKILEKATINKMLAHGE